MIEANRLTVDYGSVRILSDVSISADTGKLVAIIGANGAGKTTLLRTLSGLMPHSAGEVRLAGDPMGTLAPHLLARRGLVHVPQGRQIIANLSVRTNLRLGARNVEDLPAGEIAERIEREFDRFPILRERADLPGGSLSGGEQQMLALSRGLMMRPKVLMLDEPSLGLAPRVVQDILRTLRSLADEGLTILLVEQLARLALSVADYAYVLRSGKIVMDGAAPDLLASEELLHGYLG